MANLIPVFTPATLEQQFRAWVGNLKRSRALRLAQVEIDCEDQLDEVRQLWCRRDLLRDRIEAASERAANAYDRREPSWRKTNAGLRRFDRFLQARIARPARQLAALEARINKLVRPAQAARQSVEDGYARTLAAGQRRLKRLQKSEAETRTAYGQKNTRRNKR